MNLIYGGKKTNAFYLLEDGLGADGLSVSRRKKGFTNYPKIQDLVRAGLLERRSAGPRGGDRWFTTPDGAIALIGVSFKQEG